jgi:restriction system protein
MKKKGENEFVRWIGPLLDALRELGGSGKPREASDLVAKNEKVPAAALEATNKNGGSRFYNQVAWARQYLVWEELLDPSKRGTWTLTKKGWSTKLNYEESRRIFLKWVALNQKATRSESEEQIIETQESENPETYEAREQLDLLQVLRKLTPRGFEQVCGLLLRESGFEKVEVLGRTGDGGFDGTGRLSINPFVSFAISFQCKRYTGVVGRSEIGDFRNSMLGRAEKGIFLTTGHFSTPAKEEATRVDPKIELVDGERLVEMFQEKLLGVTQKTILEVNLPFFEPYLEV